MAGDGRDRKTRGRRIREPREAKESAADRRADGRGRRDAEADRGPAEPATAPQGARPEAASGVDADAEDLGRWAEAFAEESFVETDAVAAVRERAERWLAAGRPVHLVGPTGCGKTALATELARRRDRPAVFLNGDADLSTADLVGEYAETERESVRDRYVHNVLKSRDVVRDRWVDNPLTVAVREGATLVYNEFSRTDPAANNVLLSVLEEGVLELPGARGDSRYVEVHPEFRAVLTSNTAEYAGVHRPQDALLDRLVGIHMTFYDRETEREIVARQVPALDERAVERVVDAFRALRDDEAVDQTVGTRAMVMTAEALTVASEVDDALFTELCLDAVGSKAADRAALADLREAVERAVAAAGDAERASDRGAENGSDTT